MPTAVFEHKRTSSSSKHSMDPRGWSRDFPHASRMGDSTISSLARERALRKGGVSRVSKMPPNRHQDAMMQSWQVRAEVLQVENRILWDVVLELQNHLPPGVSQASLRSVLAREEALEATKNARLGMQSLRHFSTDIPCPPGSPPPPSPPPSPKTADTKFHVALPENLVDINNKRPLSATNFGKDERFHKSRRISKGDLPSSMAQDSPSGENHDSVRNGVRFTIPTRFIDGSPIVTGNRMNSHSRDQIFRLGRFTL